MSGSACRRGFWRALRDSVDGLLRGCKSEHDQAVEVVLWRPTLLQRAFWGDGESVETKENLD